MFWTDIRRKQAHTGNFRSEAFYSSERYKGRQQDHLHGDAQYGGGISVHANRTDHGGKSIYPFYRTLRRRLKFWIYQTTQNKYRIYNPGSVLLCNNKGGGENDCFLRLPCFIVHSKTSVLPRSLSFIGLYAKRFKESKITYLIWFLRNCRKIL